METPTIMEGGSLYINDPAQNTFRLPSQISLSDGNGSYQNFTLVVVQILQGRGQYPILERAREGNWKTEIEFANSTLYVTSSFLLPRLLVQRRMMGAFNYESELPLAFGVLSNIGIHAANVMRQRG